MPFLAPLPKKLHMGMPAVLIATLFGAGRLPYAPGSFGSLLALIIIFPLHLYFGLAGILAFFALALLFGAWAAGLFAKHAKYSDPRAVVIDEAAGQALVLLLALPSLSHYLAAFLLFRLFDIWKPFPISTLEEKLPPPYGIMCDDVAAALYALPLFYGLLFWEIL